MNGEAVKQYIETTIMQLVHEAKTDTQYRDPLIVNISADHPQFENLQEVVHPTHKLPKDLLPSARSVISFFLPFKGHVVRANARDREKVAKEWAVAYIETNALIERITGRIIRDLAEQGIMAVTEPPTGNFNRDSLVSPWSHKSVAVIAGLGSFGLHHLVITDLGCAGRFGSLVLDVEMPIDEIPPKERCLYFIDGSCLECVLLCPVDALDESVGLDKGRCWTKCRKNADELQDLGGVTVCGKCAVGICALEATD
jgi:epoxyqueuosine reductase QueG